MSALAMRVLAALFLECHDFVGAVLRHDLGSNGCASNQRRPYLPFRGQNLRERDRRTGISGQTVDFQNVSWRDSILFAAGANHRVHGPTLLSKVSTAETSAPTGARTIVTDYPQSTRWPGLPDHRVPSTPRRW